MPPQQRVNELTFRGLVLGSVITLAFTAANIYLGLKVGLTVASSIPAAVISMAVLSFVRDSSILENNIVQTVASAAGTLSAIIFVLPGLVIVGWWTGFPFWTSFFICVTGGVLGVLYTIPLRRALVTTSDLPYPEGVAAAEVLKVGSGRRGEEGTDAGSARQGFTAVVLGSVVSAALAIITATRIAAAEVQGYFRLGATSASGYDVAFSLALVGAGHLVGLSVGLAMLVGLLISWAAAVPILTHLYPAAPGVGFAAHTAAVWGTQVRFIGAGTIGVAATWSLLTLIKPVVSGLFATMAASRAGGVEIDERDRDLSPLWIVALGILCLVGTAWLTTSFVGPTVLAPDTTRLIVIALPFVLLGGFLIAAICGFMAGLIGASNSPISGVGILAVVIAASVLVAIENPSPERAHALVAFALFVTSIVFACATISNDNLQDLKTGQLVGASPWRQQIALIVGVLAGSAVIPPILNLLAHAYGFAGAANVGVISHQALPAPQATLIAALAQGVIARNLNWTMIGIGAAIGVVLIVFDYGLAAAKVRRVPPLAVGIGIYLPMSATFAVVVGSVIGHVYDMWAARTPAPERAQRLGVLVASGMIVGESLFGVLNAGLIVAFTSDAPLALVGANFWPAKLLGVALFCLSVGWLYRWMTQHARTA